MREGKAQKPQWKAKAGGWKETGRGGGSNLAASHDESGAFGGHLGITRFPQEREWGRRGVEEWRSGGNSWVGTGEGGEKGKVSEDAKAK